jgi:phosphonate transport system substrate-binding protein
MLKIIPFIGILLLSSHLWADNTSSPLTLGIHPYLNPEVLKKRFSPLADHLSNQLQRPINIQVANNYAEHIRYIGTDQLDIAYMGPASYVQMIAEYGEKPTLACLEVNHRTWFQGVIINRQDHPANELSDLQNARFAFGDPHSTMSHLVPRYMLMEAELVKGLNSRFLGSHSNVAEAVLMGDFDAGAVKEAVFHAQKANGLKALAFTPKLSEHLFITRSTLPTELIKRLRLMLQNVHQQPGGEKILHAIKPSITRLMPVKSGDYDNLMKIMHSLQQAGF